MVFKTALENEGWKRVLPISGLFKKYNLNPDRIELEFTEAFGQNMVIFTMVFRRAPSEGDELFLVLATAPYIFFPLFSNRNNRFYYFF